MTGDRFSQMPEIREESRDPRSRSRWGRRGHDEGFSLMEMVVVIAIILILSAFAAPSVLNAVRNYQLIASVNSVAAAVERARYEAIRQNCLMSTHFNSTTNPREFTVITTTGTGCAPTQPKNMVYALSSNTAVPAAAASNPTSCSLTGNYASASFPTGYDVTFSPTGTTMQNYSSSCSGPLCTPSAPLWLEGNSVYVFYVEHTLNQKWGAVTVTPSGYIKKWLCENTEWVQQ